jgi:4-oxalocrotonate tautomerase
MPIITVKVFEDELAETQTAKLINDITEAVIPFVGEALRTSTWVLVEEIKSGYWGIGRKPFGLADLRKIQQGAAQQRGEQPGPLQEVSQLDGFHHLGLLSTGDARVNAPIDCVGVLTLG